MAVFRTTNPRAIIFHSTEFYIWGRIIVYYNTDSGDVLVKPGECETGYYMDNNNNTASAFLLMLEE